MNDRHIFISHASNDKTLVDAFRDLLVLGIGVPQKNIFCTSLESTGIPEGQNFIQFIQSKIQDPALVIMLITPSYYESAFCLCELGAAWAMSHNSFPLIVPPIDFKNLKAVLHGTQVGMISDPSSLDRLRDRVNDALDLKPGPTATWNFKCDQFLDKLKSMLKDLAGFTKIDFERYALIQQQYEVAKQEMSTLTEQNEQLKRKIEELSKLKDKVEVAQVLGAGEPDLEQFLALANEAKTSLQRFSNSVREVIYYHFAGGALSSPGWGEDMNRDEMARAVEDRYLREQAGGRVIPNRNDPAVDGAMELVSAVDTFLRKAPEDFHALFKDKYGLEADITSRRLWRRFLGLLAY